MNYRFLKRMAANIILVLLLFTLWGCSLAVPDGDGEQTGDVLLGAMLTRDYIEKTYADVLWGEEGIEKITFKGLDAPYALYNIWQDEERGPIIGVVGSEGVDYNNHISVIDEASEYLLSINAYLLKDDKAESQIVYMNPIYMTADKQIYAAAGDSASFSGVFGEDGVTIEKSMMEKETFQWNDTKLEATIKITADCCLKERTEKVWFSQFDKNHELVKKEEYEAGQAPTEIYAEEQTEYIMVTTWQNGDIEKDREVCSWDGETTYEPESGESAGRERNASLQQTFYPDEAGFLLKQSTWVIWP